MKRSPPSKRRATSRASKRSKSAQRTFPALTCEVCGLTEFDAPVATRWLQGHALVLCHECWLTPLPENASKRDALVETRSRSSTPGARRDREEAALALAFTASSYYDPHLHSHMLLRIEAARAEYERLHALGRFDLPDWIRLRAARAAVRRGHIRSGDEDHPAVEPYYALERGAYARILFSAFCQARRVPAELHDWVYDSARAGTWLRVTGWGGTYRIEPRVGPYTDTTRWQGPPCVTWGRHTPSSDRGNGPWVTRMNKTRGWSAAKKAAYFVELADAKERELYEALIADISQRQELPSFPGDERFGDIDREELKYRLHVRLCDLCREKGGESAPRERGRPAHTFWCLDAKGNEADPKMSWLGDQIDRPWNQKLVFHASLALGAKVRTS